MIEKILTDIENDNGAFAMKVKDAFQINGFMKTTHEDFGHTFRLLESADIDPDKFDFKF